MGKISELYIEIEELVYAGVSAEEIAKVVNLPLRDIEFIEKDLLELTNPHNYGPCYD